MKEIIPIKTRKILAVSLSVLLFTASGCSSPNGEQISSTIGSPAPDRSSSGAYESAVNSNGETGSNNNTEESTASAVQSSSEGSSDNSEWVAYRDDDYQLHVKKKDGTEDRVLVDDIVLAPCVVGEWVYYIYPLIEIDKVKLDGSQKTKVCDLTPEIMEINGNTAVAAEYKDGYILYKTQQLHEVGNNSSYPEHYYKLDPEKNKITEVNHNEM